MSTRLSRFWAFALTLGFALSQMLGLAHLALVQHAPCFEHGGMMHLDDGGHAHTEADAADPSNRFASAEIEDHGHDDCTFGVRDRDALCLPRGVALEPPTFVTARVHAPVGYRADFRRAALWLVAPKQGPPARV